jgi:hypothetical protein
MNKSRSRMALAIVLAFLAGGAIAYNWEARVQSKNVDYSQLLILSELEHQANILVAISKNDLQQASEFSLARMQSDLSVFEDAIDKKDPPVDRQRLCKSVLNTDHKIATYLKTEPTKGQQVRSSLDKWEKWCGGTANASP